jgi:hypothetical protein
MVIKVKIFVKNEENPLFLEYLEQKSGNLFEGFKILENLGMPVPSLVMKEEFKKEFGHFVNFTIGPLPETFSFKDFDVIFTHLKETLEDKFKISQLLFTYDIQQHNEHSELQEQSGD